MSDKQSGQCHCRAIKFRVTGDSQFQFFCHCHDCRQLNGGGHLAGITYKATDFALLEGQPHVYDYAGGSGKPIHLHFCPRCGTHLYALPEEYAGMVVVRASALDDSSDYRPQKSIYAHRAHPWSTIIEGSRKQ